MTETVEHGSLPATSLAGGGALLLVAAASAVSTSRLVAPRLGVGAWAVEAAYSVAAPLAFLALPLLLRRRQRAARWPFREGVRWAGPGALPPAAAAAGAGVGLYTGFFQHLHAGGLSWSLGVGLGLLAPISLGLVAAAAGPAWRALLAVLGLAAAFELGLTAGLHLGTRPQTLSLSLPTIALLHLGALAVLLVHAGRRLRAAAPAARLGVAARLAVGLLLATAATCLSAGLLASRFGFAARRARALAALVEAEVAPFVRRDVAALLPAAWDDQGWTPARWAALERAVGVGTVATSRGAGDEERLEAVHQARGAHALPPRLLELVIEAPARGAERRVLAWYTSYGGAFRREASPELQEGEVDGLAFTSRSGASALPLHLTVSGRLVGPDGTPYEVTVLWENDPLLRPRAGPTIDDLLPR